MVNEVSDGVPLGPRLDRAGEPSGEDDRPTEIRVRGHFDEDPDEWTQSLRAIDQAPDLHPNPWAWIDSGTDESRLVEIGAHHVTAVLVTFDAERWLPETLAGLAALDHRPTRIVAIDNESTDSTRRLLRRALEQEILDALYEGERDFGFGEAVASALRQDRRHPTASAVPRPSRPDRDGDELEDDEEEVFGDNEHADDDVELRDAEDEHREDDDEHDQDEDEHHHDVMLDAGELDADELDEDEDPDEDELEDDDETADEGEALSYPEALHTDERDPESATPTSATPTTGRPLWRGRRTTGTTGSGSCTTTPYPRPMR